MFPCNETITYTEAENAQSNSPSSVSSTTSGVSSAWLEGLRRREGTGGRSESVGGDINGEIGL